MSQLNRLRAFRQAIYENGLGKETDAQFELLDALLVARRGCSFAELTLSPLFRRQWPSAYAALERGSRVDRHANIGRGKIGLGGFRGLLAEERLWGIPKVLETPEGTDGTGHQRDLDALRGLVVGA